MARRIVVVSIEGNPREVTEMVKATREPHTSKVGDSSTLKVSSMVLKPEGTDVGRSTPKDYFDVKRVIDSVLDRQYDYHVTYEKVFGGWTASVVEANTGKTPFISAPTSFGVVTTRVNNYLTGVGALNARGSGRVKYEVIND